MPRMYSDSTLNLIREIGGRKIDEADKAIEDMVSGTGQAQMWEIADIANVCILILMLKARQAR